jgi:aromatic-L-amino-acid decarboxylase
MSVAKAARVAGFPAESVRVLPVDARFRLDVAALRKAIASDLAAGAAPFLVVANAGSTNVGAIDPIGEIVQIARAHGMWVHADAAYGGFFRLVPEGAARLRGIEECDSVTLDPHKGLFLPYGTGCVVVRDPATLRRAFAGDAEYLRDVASDGDSVSFSEISPELSREFRGLRLWLPLQLHGIAAFRLQIAEKLALARLVYERLSADPKFEVVDEPQLSIVAFRLARGGDEANRELLSRVNGKRRAFLSSTVLDGKVTLRLCVLSFRSHEDRVEETLATLRAEAAALGVGR